MEIKRSNVSPKETIKDVREKLSKAELQLEILLSGCYCHMCDTHKAKSYFYTSYNPEIKSRVTPICKKCAEKIALRIDDDGNEHGCTKESVMKALEYLDKPFIGDLWDSSFFEYTSESTGNKKKNIWACYIKNVSMKQYKDLRWKDGDVFKKKGFNLDYADEVIPSKVEEQRRLQEEQRILEEQDYYMKNRRDVMRKIGYDPFKNYPKEEDKSYLYASLNNMIDDDTQQDGNKLRAVIQIIQAHNQVDKINESINAIISSPQKIAAELAYLDKASGTVDKIMRSANALAKDNGIASNFNNSKSKGSNTLSGKIKELTEKKFSGADINMFDIETCEGMRQVAELSEKARHAQIGYDENIAKEIKDIKVELVEAMTKERDAALETARLLLDENNKIKEFLKAQKLIDDNNKVIDYET